MERKEIIEILRVGLKATSPYNGQPWQFQFKNDVLSIFEIYSRGGFLENFKEVPFYSLGPLLHNLSEGAKHFQYAMTYRLKTRETDLYQALCEVKFQKSSTLPNYDIAHVMSRYTNRKKHRDEYLSPRVLEKIRNSFSGETRAVLNVTNSEAIINNCAALERIRMGNSGLNKEIINQLCYTPEEAEKSRRGLDLRVLEIPAFSQQFLRFSRNEIFRRTIGQSILAQKVAERSHRKLLRETALLIAFKESDASAEVLVRDWMDIQKIINLLNKDGLSSHIVASSVDIAKISRDFFSKKESDTIDQIEKNIEYHLGIKPQEILTLLRVGYADECAVKSLRVSPEDLLLPETN